MMKQFGHALCWAVLLHPTFAHAQEEAVVEQLAPVLAAEDARRWEPELFQRALFAADSMVRRTAALAAGRIGDFRATPQLLQLLDQPDSTVRVMAAFALGLLGDSAAIEPLIQRLTGLPPLDTATAAEAVTAIAKLGGRRSGEFFASVLGGKVALSQVDPAPALGQMLLESWRLGPAAPTDALLRFAEDTAPVVRWRTLYSLARLKAPGAANYLIAGLRSDDASARAIAARALTRDYAIAARVAPGSVAGLLGRAIDDNDAGVRVNALRALGTYRDSSQVPAIASKLDDADPNVRVQAAASLGEVRSAAAVPALQRALDGQGNFAVQREALLGLARVSSPAFKAAAARWRSSSDWRERAIAAEGWALAGAAGPAWFLSDADSRVVAAGLQSWVEVRSSPAAALIAAARNLLTHPDAAVRSVAADVLSKRPQAGDLPGLVRMYQRSLRDSFPDASLAALSAIVAIAGTGNAAKARVDREFLGTVSRPANYLLRRWAEEHWPAAAAHWGPAYPIATERTLQDYRELARQFLLAPDSVARPHVFVEVEQRGALELELFGPEAPLTVANFLQLVDRRFFDGHRWHRVVPNFVVQDGDPRGDGYGGPGGAIRDEINRHRYGAKPMLGMALSGPDTGSSQWFITLSSQPHLDGTYTIFGRVVNNVGTLTRITQGDVIRRVRR
ncbi:MAG TPA: HEAT repeat domain-containing protein [Gemmatimonadales bacterium]|nr:HEAT repeat domain-containing protein [Gemmatimonadales bacterium]